MDLFLGNYTVSPEEGASKVSPLNKNRDWKFYAVSVIYSEFGNKWISDMIAHLNLKLVAGTKTAACGKWLFLVSGVACGILIVF
jgi:hypothetical protein